MNGPGWTNRPRVALALGLGCLIVGGAVVQSQPRRDRRPRRGAQHVRGPAPGAPLRALTAAEREAFDEGQADFTELETMAGGLGPVFNARSCAECHSQGGIGGSSPDLATSRVTRIGRLTNGAFDPLEGLGGMLLQARSVKEFDPSCPFGGETVPGEATLVSHRITTPLFGAGLIEAIPAAEILRRADPQGRNPDHIAGIPNLVTNPDTGRQEVGRFGWKGHVSDLHVFAGDAYLNEMGITNPTFPDENLPQGQPIPAAYDLVDEIEADDEEVEALATFMRFLAPPQRKPPSPTAQQGERLFLSVGCAACHTPTMRTGNSPVAALRRQEVRLYSDLLLHDMGEALDDGMVMGTATGRQWRTAPLWGLSRRRFLLHDGRATTPEQATLLHGGEASAAVTRVRRMRPAEQRALAAFLRSL